ncbi:MAG: peptidase [Krumholzibacteria bacterium]|nr:peptidase [Candidatus Krumholzibacteria bacterium]
MHRPNERFRHVAALAALLGAAALLCGCGPKGADDVTRNQAQDCGWTAGELPVVPDLDARLAAYVRTELDPDTSHLDPAEQATLAKLVEAAKVMHDLFAEQATPCRAELAARIGDLPAGLQAGVRRYFAINLGPWDRRFDRQPFFGSWPHPEGANFYPLDLTAQEKAAIADPARGLDGLFTMVRRDADGALQAVPYSVHFRTGLEHAADLLREAAALTGNASLAAFLRSRADAFLSDDYYASDMLWMDLDSDVEITIGPYETYEDGLFGYKAAFEAFVTVTDPLESARLAKFKDELPWLESRLPIGDEHKNPGRGSDSPIRVVDEVYSAGDTRAGVQTIAFNLPNDERVREAKGSKKVLLRNVMNAKFNRILRPIAEQLVIDDQLGDLTAESFFLHTLWHEMSHGLGPGRITKDGRATEVRLELKDLYSTLEEAKADAMGEWTIFELHAAGRDYFPPEIVRQQAATYLAGLFRSVRFGIGEAHGQANAIQFNYLLEKQAIAWHPDVQRFSVDTAVFVPAIGDLVAQICLLQALGDYDGTSAFITKYGGLPPVLEAALRRLDGIPVDIEPVFDRWD